MAENVETTVEVRRNDAERRYELLLDSEVAGFSEFKPIDGKVVVTHTETLPAYAGQGVASRLVSAMLDDIRARDEKIVPLCPFVKRYLSEHDGYDDIVDHG